MWISSEIWDDDAKAGIEEGIIRKGGKLAGMGTLIFNKWTDKVTGEERKIFKLRVLEILDKADIERLGLDDNLEKKARGAGKRSLAGGQQEAPDMESQVADSFTQAPSTRSVPSSVWPKPKSSPPAASAFGKRKLADNINGDFDGFDDDADPRIPF